MISVLYFCPFANNSKSGVQRFAREITEGAKTIPIKSYQLFWNRENGLFLSYLGLFREFLSLQPKIEIIHFVVLSPYILPFMIIARLKKKKIIITYHGIYTKEISKFRQPIQYLLFLITDKISRLISDRLVSLNKYLLNELNIRTNYTIIPNPYIPKKTVNHESAFPKIADILLLTATTFKIEKKAEGLNYLLRVIEKVSIPSRDIKLLVFGNGKHLEKFKKKYGYIKNIKFMGFSGIFNDYLKDADAYLHISGLDNQPYVIMEAMMNEKVIFCNQLDGVLEMMDSNNNYIVELDQDSINDGLKKLLHDIVFNNKKFKEMGLKNKEFAINMFAHEKVMKKYLTLYEALATGK